MILRMKGEAGFSAGNGTVVDGPLTICHTSSKDEISLTL